MTAIRAHGSYDAHDITLSEAITGRRSVRNFDPDTHITRDELVGMLDEASRAPSSVNMQPWRFLVVESDEARKKLLPLMRLNKRQTRDASDLIVVFGDLECYRKAERIYGQAAQRGIIPTLMAKAQLAAIVPAYRKFTRDKMTRVVHIDSSLMAMQLMLVAREHGYDTNPIGGFDEDRIAETFGIDPNRYVPVIIIAIGKARKPGHESYRLPANELIWWNDVNALESGTEEQQEKGRLS
ncbi:nitroreductase [Bifidobacterium minimum]|jgi:nitroreductase|uniref:Nitroreductase n=1 Tax=Bifidobacterium minimum TaxID=1693 RepID=A0A087BSN8_9BIFI|nr:nitroreductase family protein [Bifidobacterium minimum]KFI74038.1 nitroreductase [Bifidobacterium minimum]